MAKEPERPHQAFRVPGGVDWQSLVATPGSDTAEKVQKARQDLKKMLLTSLQMQHLVVLAGSGCSRCAGGPSMQDLWNSAVGEEPTDQAKATAGKIRHDLTDTNIETFLSRIEAFLQVDEDEEVLALLNASKQVIQKKCSEFLRPEKLEAHKIFLHRLSRRRLRDPRLKVFTSNYDLCFERAASELGIVALDGFSFTAPRLYDPRFFGYDIIRRPRSGDDLGNYLEGVFLLYKLHGSVNWAREKGEGIREKEAPAPDEVCLIYPASGKYQQSFAQPYLESMAQYLTAVREPNTCVLVVGVGFNDDHLSEPLLSAIRSNPNLRVIIANLESQTKAADECSPRPWKQLSELAERGEDVWFVATSFADFAQMIPDFKALTPADMLMKAVQGVVRGNDE